MCVVCLSIYQYIICVQEPLGVMKVPHLQSFRSVIHHVVLGSKPRPLQEQSVLLTGEPTLQHYKRDTVQPLPLGFLLDHYLEECFGFIQPKHCKMKNANFRNLEMAQQLKTCCFSRGSKVSSQHLHCAHTQ